MGKKNSGDLRLETLPEAVVYQAIRDVKSTNPKTCRGSLLWLLDSGLQWQKFTNINIRELFLQTLAGALDIGKVYKSGEKKRCTKKRYQGN